MILYREWGEEWVNDGGSAFFVLVDLGSLIITVKNKIYVFFFFLNLCLQLDKLKVLIFVKIF